MAAQGTSRPYQHSSTESLENLARENPHDGPLLYAITLELRQRGRKRARRAADVVAALQEALEQPADASAAARQPARAGAGDGPSARAAASYSTSELIARPTLVERYQALRVTFTAEAEVLARWGLTPLLPAELRGYLFEAWSQRFAALGSDAHPHGLTRVDLERDRAALTGRPGPAAEREAG